MNRAHSGSRHLPAQQRESFVPGFGFVPHPLDVDIRHLSCTTLHLSGAGRDVAVYVASCPDGCGLVAWTDSMLPFTAPDLEAVKARAANRDARTPGEGVEQ